MVVIFCGPEHAIFGDDNRRRLGVSILYSILFKDCQFLYWGEEVKVDDLNVGQIKSSLSS